MNIKRHRVVSSQSPFPGITQDLQKQAVQCAENEGWPIPADLPEPLRTVAQASFAHRMGSDAPRARVIAALGPEGPGPTMRRLKVLAAMYPDEYRAYYNFAYFGLNGGQRYQESLDQLTLAINVQNPQRGSASYLQGALHSALGQHDEAIAAFERSQSLGVRGQLRQYAEAYAAQRRFTDARRILASTTAGGLRAGAFEERLPDISFPLDQGRWDEALAEAAVRRGGGRLGAAVLCVAGEGVGLVGCGGRGGMCRVRLVRHHLGGAARPRHRHSAAPATPATD